jgi:ABC-type long-subunit fatty acid transport system fused permease/ATPase subunit
MSSAVQELQFTFRDITKDVVGVLSTVAIMGVLIIVLPILIQLQKTIASLQGTTGAGTATSRTQTAQVGTYKTPATYSAVKMK